MAGVAKAIPAALTEFSANAAEGDTTEVRHLLRREHAQRLASEVGVNILKEGGNAIDAAVAVGYALAVVLPCCGNIGGGGFAALVTHARSRLLAPGASCFDRETRTTTRGDRR